MESKKISLLKHYALFLAGLYLLSAGIVLILRSTLGITPISSVNYVMSLHSPLSLGGATFCLNSLMILFQLWFLRGEAGCRRERFEVLLQIPFSFLFGLFIDLNMSLTVWLQPVSYMACLATLLSGCIVQATGISAEVKAHVVMMSAEGFVFFGSRRYHKDFGRFKTAFDVGLVLIAILLSLLLSGRIEGVREGTLISAACTGYLVSFISRRVMTRSNFYTVRHLLRRHQAARN